MVTLKKYDLEGKEIGNEELAFDKFEVNEQMIKDYIVALNTNARQWSASTKGRKEVNATGAKPHKQKGTGMARQGSLAAPQYRGGGRVFAPKPKFDQYVKRNKKEKKAVIRALLSDKLLDNKAIVLKYDDSNISKTKQISKFLQSLNIYEKRVLVITKLDLALNFKRCIRNIQRTDAKDAGNVNGYDLALCQNLVLTENALDEIKTVLKG